MVVEKVKPVEEMPPDFGRLRFLVQLGVGVAPTEEEVKVAYKTWALWLHPNKHGNHVAKATQLIKWLNASYKAWRTTRKGRVPPRLMAEVPNFLFNPKYFKYGFCGR